jgi:hypothetical protein
MFYPGNASDCCKGKRREQQENSTISFHHVAVIVIRVNCLC